MFDAPSLPLRMGHLRGIPIESLFTLFYSSWARAMSVLFLLRLCVPVDLLFLPVSTQISNCALKLYYVKGYVLFNGLSG